MTPTSRLALLLGPLVSGVAWMFLFDAVLVVVGAAFGFHVHIGGLLVLAVLLALFMLSMASFSVAMALLTKEISGFAAVVNGLNLPVLLLAGVLLPVSIGPGWMKVLAHFNPLYYLVAAARSLGVGTFSGGATWQAFAVLVPLCRADARVGDARLPPGGRLTRFLSRVGGGFPRSSRGPSSKAASTTNPTPRRGAGPPSPSRLLDPVAAEVSA